MVRGKVSNSAIRPLNPEKDFYAAVRNVRTGGVEMPRVARRIAELSASIHYRCFRKSAGIDSLSLQLLSQSLMTSTSELPPEVPMTPFVTEHSQGGIPSQRLLKGDI